MSTATVVRRMRQTLATREGRREAACDVCIAFTLSFAWLAVVAWTALYLVFWDPLELDLLKYVEHIR